MPRPFADHPMPVRPAAVRSMPALFGRLTERSATDVSPPERIV
ncbi:MULTISPECIES: hypothetical protein [Streptomyces]|uniref:Uncharacterized protein n=1 Tax=Streptomyces stelliscabiei TaxID=146820 RepID=A0A8I0PF81_9ACTN|nr:MULTISPECIES: hypothetical protein [Streptomyces]MBE1600513.1 hypothetical protein [Streptomyces stelliscabiei]MDX2518328.1 hypothetical protein [Streptomyces stelliscabiei]MDX2554430.1 hypothetical protein [Streptomyces stelliscabiei]MDX2613639.1 hypothetical protein [Streptomyces stelliscabiei]MDX2639233.1 hypothetical protein [Streptomyces stelliscabiei]